ncbi:MAG: histidinol-phosphate transaminase [Desulfobacteraceae bacterium]
MNFNICKNLHAIKPYEPGKPIEELEREYRIKSAVKLASNENPEGCSPGVRNAVTQALASVHRYPDSSAHAVTEALAEKFGVRPTNIVMGNGSDDIIALLAATCLDPEDQALMPSPSFLMYEISVRAAKGEPVKVPLRDFAVDLDAMLSAVNGRTRMIFLTNPFNPTGSVISEEQFGRFAEKVPGDVLIVVDEAYIEFVREKGVYMSLARPLEDPRVITLRTFSKAYGLAGFRVGYGVMDESLAGYLHRVRQPFNVNSLALAAAEAALQDQQFLETSLDTIWKGMDYLARELSGMGLEFPRSHANFMMVDVKTDSKAVFNSLLEKGIIVKSMKSYGYDEHIRVNAGLESENRSFIEALKEVLKG